MGFYEARVLPHLVDAALSGRQFERLRRRVTERVAGDVLEVGFGSGRNVPYYGPSVRRVLAVDPAVTGRKIAAKRVAASPTPIEYVGLDGEQLPLDDASVDDVLTTWTLCTIPDAAQALGEMRRVLRPGGALHFLEHGRSPDESVVRWQDRLTPIQRRVAGGCHLNRAIAQLVTDAGFEMSELTNYYLKGPKFFGYMYEGIATNPR
jgi:ubiquinone/menaquinone biosynthesis C-methylase UbiE